MQQARRALLGLALFGGMSRLFALEAAPSGGGGVRRLEQELGEIVANPACQLASLSVVALRAGQVCYEGHFGHRTIDASGGTPVTGRTMFRIASISKMMTTLGVMRLVEQGQLSLDADVGEYLGYALRNPHFPDQPITLRMLLSHTASLRDSAGYSWGFERRLSDILVPGGPHYGDGAMWSASAGPGRFFTYCNLNWAVIGTLMERVTGERFDRLMKRLLLDPLGLRGGYNPSEFSAAELADLATLYRKRTVDTEVWDPNGPWIAQVDDYSARPPTRPAGIESYVPGTNATPFSPTGGLRISAADMAKVMRMLANRGRHQGRQFLKEATVAAMLSRQWTFDGRGGNGDSNRNLFYAWGLGNQHFEDKPLTGHQVVAHGGFSGIGHLGDAYGLRSAFLLDPATGDGMVALVGGTATDPERYPGRYSSLARFQEQILSALHRRAILGDAT